MNAADLALAERIYAMVRYQYVDMVSIATLIAKEKTDARRAALEEAAKEVDRLAYASPNESRKITLEDTAARIRALLDAAPKETT